MAARVLVTDFPFANLDLEREILGRLGCELVVAPGTGEDELADAARGCEAILVCWAPVTEKVIAAAAESGCKVISRYGIGYDNIDVEAATERGILVTYVPDYCLDEVADHALALLLSLARGVHHAALSVREGEWAVPQHGLHRIRDRRLAVIGAGAIGRRVIERTLPLGLRTVGFDPFVDSWDVAAERADSFEEAVAEADFVSLHTPLTPESRHLVNRESIERMRSAPIIVNTARGALIDADAALEALDSGAISGLALDVTDPEPPPADHPLRTHPRVVLTPHMSFYSVEAQEELRRRAAQEVARAMRGEAPDRPVNPEVREGAR